MVLGCVCAEEMLRGVPGCSESHVEGVEALGVVSLTSDPGERGCGNPAGLSLFKIEPKRLSCCLNGELSFL